jgi:hypothetical protein
MFSGAVTHAPFLPVERERQAHIRGITHCTHTCPEVSAFCVRHKAWKTQTERVQPGYYIVLMPHLWHMHARSLSKNLIIRVCLVTKSGRKNCVAIKMSTAPQLKERKPRNVINLMVFLRIKEEQDAPARGRAEKAICRARERESREQRESRER